MTTSGTYSFTVTRDDIIRQAMLNIRKLDPDETPTASETDDCARVLNMMCKQWMGKSDFAPGLKVWTRKRGYLLLSSTQGYMTIGPSQLGWTNALTFTTLSATAASGASTITVTSTTGFAATYHVVVRLDDNSLQYFTESGAPSGNTITLSSTLNSQASSGNVVYVYATAAQNIRSLETAILRQTYDNTDMVVDIMTVQSYDALPNKADPTNLGDPAAIYFEEGLSSSTIYTDVGAAIDTSKFLILTYQEPVQDFNNPLDNPYYPQEWYLALCWGLTEQICPMFGANWTDKMENLKNTALMIARNHSAENTELYFEPYAEQ